MTKDNLGSFMKTSKCVTEIRNLNKLELVLYEYKNSSP